MKWVNDTLKRVFEIDERLTSVEDTFSEFAYNTLQAVQSALKKNWVLDTQSEALYGLHLALCIDTKDPWAQGRIRFYHPAISPKETPVDSLPWAWPISTLSGFDDSGALWVPPAGSTVCIIFENGDRHLPYYVGTTWTRNRGEPPHSWNVGVPEYECIHQGHRNGYFVGKNDESQVLPPSNTENYNIKDFDDLKSFEQDTEALLKVTPSHIYEIKTPGKHRLKFDDGNYYCNQRFTHLELGSSGGHTFLMWDDHMHAAAQHVNPKACECGPNASGGPGSGIACSDPFIGDDEDCRKVRQPPMCGDYAEIECENQLFKHESEVRAFRGPCTPQNNKCILKQTGVFLSSISGHVFVMDDEVSEPEGIPNWERGTAPFPFGCENKFYGKMYMKSATGHMIKLGDAEDEPNIRSGDFIHQSDPEFEPNGIQIVTAAGHRVELNDHTLSSKKGGEFRHIKIESTSKHSLMMVDEGVDNKPPDRKEGGEPTANADKAYVALKTGYGLQLLMRDDNNQDGDAEGQFIELMSPQKKNEHGPHLFRMQESPPSDPGFILLKSGGYYIGVSTDIWVEQVGIKDFPGYPASKITFVTESDFHMANEVYFYKSGVEVHFADDIIALGAGLDCDSVELGPNTVPCFMPVACWGPCGLTISDRVFVSASDEATSVVPIMGWFPTCTGLGAAGAGAAGVGAASAGAGTVATL